MPTRESYRSAVPCPTWTTPASIPSGNTVGSPNDSQTYELHSCPCGSMGLWKVA